MWTTARIVEPSNRNCSKLHIYSVHDYLIITFFLYIFSAARLDHGGHSEIIDTPLPERKRKIYSSTWDSIILKCSL